MTRVSRAQVVASFTRLTAAARALGLDTNGWQFTPGSATLGTAWSLTTGRSGSFAILGLPFGTHIGQTAREADATLTTLALALESIGYAQATRREG